MLVVVAVAIKLVQSELVAQAVVGTVLEVHLTQQQDLQIAVLAVVAVQQPTVVLGFQPLVDQVL
jgi:hypothetical protein